MSGRDPATALLRAVVAHAAASGLTLRDAACTTRDWASATFVGHRIRIAFALDGADPAAWLACLPDADWHLPGRLVADLAVERHDDAGVALSALLLLDR